MAADRNVAVVDGLEAIMRPKARLSKGIVGTMQASAMAWRKPDSHGIYATLNGSEKGEENVNTKLCTFVPFMCEG
jgi:hypothetical protein